jgi:hypothetical protein
MRLNGPAESPSEMARTGSLIRQLGRVVLGHDRAIVRAKYAQLVAGKAQMPVLKNAIGPTIRPQLQPAPTVARRYS